MKMPEKIDIKMFAPCGMNCMVCYKHCYTKKICVGCFESNEGTPVHCRKCKIKHCIKTKGITYCFECNEYPCKQIKNLEKSYNNCYNRSLIGNGEAVKEKGLMAFMKSQQLEFKCKHCGGVICLHDSECSECRQK